MAARSPRTARSLVVDNPIPALVVKIGKYPLIHHSGLGAIRTLGRLGVPVYAVEGRFAPATVSRYLTRNIPWPTTGTEPVEDLVAGLLRVGASIPGGRAVAIPTDDEAAVLLAEHADSLAHHFVLPPIPRGLPRALAGKQGLHELCQMHDVPTPWSVLVSSRDQVPELAKTASFPLVLKNCDPWVRLRDPVVGSSTVVRTASELEARAESWPSTVNVLAQEFLPHDQTTDWASQICCDANSDAAVVFTGVKVRSWPARTGVTTYAFTASNPGLAELTARFCKEIGYSGSASLDWRLDHRDGKFKLLDFNPRVGAQFRLFETDRGVDLVRALYLTLSGRNVPMGDQVDGRRLLVEHLDLLARFAYLRGERNAMNVPHGNKRELAWLAHDDLLPVLVAGGCIVGPAASRMFRLIADPLRRR